MLSAQVKKQVSRVVQLIVVQMVYNDSLTWAGNISRYPLNTYLHSLLLLLLLCTHLRGEHLAELVGGRRAGVVRAAPRQQRLEERVVRLG